MAAGSLLGEAAMLIETTHTSTVVARSQVRALHLSRDELRAQMLEDPSIAETLIHNIATRLMRIAEDLRRVDAALAGDQASAVPGTLAQLPPPAGMQPAPIH